MPSLLSRHQLASRLGCWVSLFSSSSGRGGAFLFVRGLGFGASSLVLLSLGFGASSLVLLSVFSSDVSCLKNDGS